MRWISEPDPRSGGQSSGQGHALSRIPSPTPHPPSPTNSAVIVELGGRGGTILTLSDSKLNLSLLSTLAPNPKSESRGWGNSARWKSSGCYFWSGWGWSLAFATHISNPECPRLGGAEGLRVRPLGGAKPGAAEEGSPRPPEAGQRGVPTCLARPRPTSRAPSGTGGEQAPPLGRFPLWAAEPHPFHCRPQTERFEVAALPSPIPSAAPPPLCPHRGSGQALCMGMGPVAPPGHSLEIHPREDPAQGLPPGTPRRGV